MTNPAIDIPNLLYRYADCIDAGEFSSAAKLFDHGCLEIDGNAIKGETALTQLWNSWVKLYDGKPLTQHLITNPIITLSDDEQTASCQSQWTVIQATPSLPLQAIASGRYHDRFEVIDGAWQFTKRAYAGVELIGDMSHHILQKLDKKSG